MLGGGGEFVEQVVLLFFCEWKDGKIRRHLLVWAEVRTVRKLPERFGHA